MAPVKKPKPILGKHYLQEWREAKKVGQQEAATAINLSRTMLSKIENGENPYQQQYVEGLARIYECSPADLIGKDPKAGAADAETKLRSALLAYGVDKDELGSAMKAIKGFKDGVSGVVPPQSDNPHDQSESENPRRAKEPS